MSFFSRLSPIRAYLDLRAFLLQRQKHELVFLVLSLVATAIVIGVLIKDSQVEMPYRPDIIYVQQWRLDRTEAEILAQQKVDQAAKEKLMAELEKKRAAKQAEFKRFDDKLTAMGL